MAENWSFLDTDSDDSDEDNPKSSAPPSKTTPAPTPTKVTSTTSQTTSTPQLTQATPTDTTWSFLDDDSTDSEEEMEFNDIEKAKECFNAIAKEFLMKAIANIQENITSSLERSKKMRSIHKLADCTYHKQLVPKLFQVLQELTAGEASARYTNRVFDVLKTIIPEIISFLDTKTNGIVCPLLTAYSIKVSSIYQSLCLVNLTGGIVPVLGILSRLVSMLCILIRVIDKIDIHLQSGVTYVLVCSADVES